MSLVAICFIIAFYSLFPITKGYAFAWPVKEGVKNERTEFIYDQPNNVQSIIKVSPDEDLIITKNEQKITYKMMSEYGINSKSSLFIILNSNFHIYQLTSHEKKLEGHRLRTEKKSIHFLQNSLNLELGSIIKLLQSTQFNHALAAYFSISPGTLNLHSKDNTYYSDLEAAITTGLSYGYSFDNKYLEVFVFNKNYTAINHNMLLFGSSFGIKPNEKIHLCLNAFLYGGFYNKTNPAVEQYIETLHTQDQFRNSILNVKLKDFFAPLNIKPYAKIIFSLHYYIKNNKSISASIGTNLLGHTLKDKYFAIGFHKTL